MKWNDVIFGILGACLGGVARLYTPSDLIQIVVSGFVGAAVLLILGRVLRARVSSWRLISTCFLVLLTVFIGLGVWYATLEDKKGAYQSLFVASDGLRLRVDPGFGSAPSSGLSAGTEVSKVGRTWRKYRSVGRLGSFFEYWWKIRTVDGVEGWAYGAFLDSPSPEEKR